MPFRTKDFLLFMLTVAFLVVGITVTAKNGVSMNNQNATVLFSDNVSNGEVIYQANLPAAKADTRKTRLASLREKMAGMVFSEKTSLEEVVVDTKKEETVVLNTGDINLCTGYAKINPTWSPSNLLFEVVEGARIVYRNVQVPPIVDEFGQTVASSTQKREVVLQLPLQAFPLATKLCLKTNVIGVALDGSLIRNDEHGLYRVFGSETLIGYALDGFPIFGVSDKAKTDECGGTIESLEYRYYLSSVREGIIGCYSGEPVSF